MTSGPQLPTVSAVVLAWKDEPWLPRSVEAVLASTGIDVNVIIVDNGVTTDVVEKFADHPAVTVLRPGRNLGYSGGCNAGAAAAIGDYIALVNSDLTVEPTTLRRLVDALDEPNAELAVASVRLADDPALINAGANPVHCLGLSWCGDMGKPEHRDQITDTAGASGSCLMSRASHWRRLGGFDDHYFAYHEDCELSIRTWRIGSRVVYVPDAIAIHRYEFSRNQFKLYMVERNRLIFVSTLWSIPALVALAPALLALELLTLLVAAKQRWGRDKVRGWVWIWRNRRYIAERRRQLQAERTVPNRQWMSLLTAEVDAAFFPLPAGRAALNAIMRGYWAVARRLV
jgi:GT2 family glycosyltransferase